MRRSHSGPRRRRRARLGGVRLRRTALPAPLDFIGSCLATGTPVSRSWAPRSSVPRPTASPRPVRAPSGAGSSWSALCSPRSPCSRVSFRSTRARPARGLRGASALRPFEIARQPCRPPVPRRVELDRRASSTPRPQNRGSRPRDRAPAPAERRAHRGRPTERGSAQAAPLRQLAGLPEDYHEVARRGAHEPDDARPERSRSPPARAQGIVPEDVV